MIPLSDDAPQLKHTPFITYLLILINVWIFFTATEQSFDIYHLRAGDILSGVNLLTLFTSAFLHIGFFHLLFNMWSLWIFGDNVEDDLGPIAYTVFYLATAAAGGLLFAFTASDPEMAVVGASGAVSGIMGAYLVLHPRNHVLTLIPLGIIFTTLRINAPIFIGIWFLIQFVGFRYTAGSDVAYAAHVGGFIAGILLALIIKKRPQQQIL